MEDQANEEQFQEDNLWDQTNEEQLLGEDTRSVEGQLLGEDIRSVEGHAGEQLHGEDMRSVEGQAGVEGQVGVDHVVKDQPVVTWERQV